MTSSLSSSIIATGGLRLPNSESSSLTEISSISGLPLSAGFDDVDEGVPISGFDERFSSPESVLICVPTVCPAIFEGVSGEGGTEELDSTGLVDLRLMVTLLEVGSAAGLADVLRVGVWGKCGSCLNSSSASSGVADSRTPIDTLAVSTDLLRDPALEIRCRFLEEGVSLSKGF